MELDRLLHMLAERNSPQACLVSDEPIQIWAESQWASANSPLAGGQLNRMLGLVAPPRVRAFVHDLNTRYSFDYDHASGSYRVDVEAINGRRTVFITRLDASGQPLRPVDSHEAMLDFKTDVPSGQPEAQRPSNSHQHIPAPRTIQSHSTRNTPAFSPSPQQSLPPTSAGAAHWFYGHAGQSMGPHTREEMASLIKSGALFEETMVFDSRIGEWQQAKLSALNGFFAVPTESEWVNPSVQNWRPQTEGEVKAEKAFVRLIVIGVPCALILLGGLIIFGKVRGSNRAYDYSTQFARYVEQQSPTTPSGALHNVQLHRESGSLTHYLGTGQYTNNYLADVKVDIAQSDLWARPTETPMNISSHDFTSDMKEHLFNSMDAGKTIDHVTVTHEKGNEYSGVMYFDDNTAKSFSAQILAFKEDGTIDDWRYDFIKDVPVTGAQ